MQAGKIGEKERAALTLVLGGAAAALAATSFFPWSYAVVLTGGLVNYIQFPWRLLALTAALLALAAAYPIAGMQGEHQKLAVVLALALSVAAVQPQLQAMWKKTECLRRRHQPAPDQRGISHSGFVSDADGQPGICGERRRFGDE